MLASYISKAQAGQVQPITNFTIQAPDLNAFIHLAIPRIAKELENDAIPNWNGKVKGYDGTIKKMLSNEKYKGEALLQKTYTVDFLSKKRAENTGQVPQYYVSESHPLSTVRRSLLFITVNKVY